MLGLAGGHGSKGHDSSLKKDPNKWNKDFETWKTDWRGDDKGHTTKMRQKCGNLEKYLNTTCPLDKALYEELSRQLDWCRQQFPEGFGEPSTEPTLEVDDTLIKKMEVITGLTGTALLIYLIISEGSRAFPPRNLVPVP